MGIILDRIKKISARNLLLSKYGTVLYQYDFSNSATTVLSGTTVTAINDNTTNVYNLTASTAKATKTSPNNYITMVDGSAVKYSHSAILLGSTS